MRPDHRKRVIQRPKRVEVRFPLGTSIGLGRTIRSGRLEVELIRRSLPHGVDHPKSTDRMFAFSVPRRKRLTIERDITPARFCRYSNMAFLSYQRCQRDHQRSRQPVRLDRQQNPTDLFLAAQTKSISGRSEGLSPAPDLEMMDRTRKLPGSSTARAGLRRPYAAVWVRHGADGNRAPSPCCSTISRRRGRLSDLISCPGRI